MGRKLTGTGKQQGETPILRGKSKVCSAIFRSAKRHLGILHLASKQTTSLLHRKGSPPVLIEKGGEKFG